MIADTILQGDIRQIAGTLPAQSVHCIVTSPPYYGLRDYGVDAQIGLEETPEEYVETMVGICRELRRVLRDDGTMWLNLGDSYASAPKGSIATDSSTLTGSKNYQANGTPPGLIDKTKIGLKPKDLIGIPWRVALALQADGWYLRSDIIWSKPNPMPESVTDRPTKAHEYIFLLSKSPRYYYDQEAVREPVTSEHSIKRNLSTPRYCGSKKNPEVAGDLVSRDYSTENGRNKRTVWTVATQPYSAAHFATFPPDLIRPCILAGCPERACPECGAPWERVVEKTGGSLPVSERHGRTGHNGQPPQISGNYWTGPTTQATDDFEPTCTCAASTAPGIVFDPFIGSGTVAQVAIEEGRRWLGCELNQDYIDLAWQRINAAKRAKLAGRNYAKTMAVESGHRQLSLIGGDDD